jgi:hypothetical protein
MADSITHADSVRSREKRQRTKPPAPRHRWVLYIVFAIVAYVGLGFFEMMFFLPSSIRVVEFECTKCHFEEIHSKNHLILFFFLPSTKSIKSKGDPSCKHDFSASKGVTVISF